MELEGPGFGWQGNIDQAIFLDHRLPEGAKIQQIHDLMKAGKYYCNSL
jgi:hypothetical protein